MGSKRRGLPFRNSEFEFGCGLWMAAFMTPALCLLFATNFTLRSAAPHREGFSYRHSGNHNLQAAATKKIRVLCDQSEKNSAATVIPRSGSQMPFFGQKLGLLLGKEVYKIKILHITYVTIAKSSLFRSRHQSRSVHTREHGQAEK